MAPRDHGSVTASPPHLPEVGDLLELSVGEAVHGGWCVARTDPAPAGPASSAGPARAAAAAPSDAAHPRPVIFVRHALPGERVRVVITQATSKFARADAVQILNASADRVQPPCPHARPGGCGGCDWQHASLPAQRALKAAIVRQQLRRIAGLERDLTVEPVPGDEAGLGWRTRVKFAVGRDGVAGLRRHRSHDVMEIGDCPIAHPLVTAARATGRIWPGAASVEVAAVPGSGQRAVVVTGAMPVLDGGGVPGVAADTVLSGKAGSSRRTVARGPGYLRQRAAGRDWRVSAAGFWQVHPGAADTLAAAVLGALRPRPGDVALDLYCGAGLFAGVLAEAVGPRGAVIGIEADAAAVRDARHNLRVTPWARVHRGDVAAVLARNGLSGASLAVLDPPRTGVARPVIDLLSAPSSAGAAPRADRARRAGQVGRIAYVSCDPATLARDIAVLAAAGWELEELRAFDAFPMTHHVECLATLSRGS
jgi:tRNA/tmRNA/rRNA uracil-C5-methylase (TrmA/RlmC/RlmD family)